MDENSIGKCECIYPWDKQVLISSLENSIEQAERVIEKANKMNDDEIFKHDLINVSKIVMRNDKIVIDRLRTMRECS